MRKNWVEISVRCVMMGKIIHADKSLGSNPRALFMWVPAIKKLEGGFGAHKNFCKRGGDEWRMKRTLFRLANEQRANREKFDLREARRPVPLVVGNGR